jgi:hypothetical protein
MLSPQGAVSVLRRPLLKSEKWRTRQMGFVHLEGVLAEREEKGAKRVPRIIYLEKN